MYKVTVQDNYNLVTAEYQVQGSKRLSEVLAKLSGRLDVGWSITVERSS